MREIKLRVYDAVGKMHYLDTEDTDDALVFRSEHHFDGYLFDGDLVVMQYTGYSDSNGQEVYEGDIIRYRPKKKYFSVKFEILKPIFSIEMSATNEEEAECVVKFESGSFVLVKENNDAYIESLHEALGEDEDREFEVIGNIYEGVSDHA